MNTKTGAINVGDEFKKGLAVMLTTIAQSVIQKGSEIPAVQKEISNQQTVAGKNLLWKYFPYAILAGGLIFVISKVR